MIKRRNFRQFKRVKTPKINDGCCNKTYARAIASAEKLESDRRMNKNTLCQNEKGLTVDVSFNLQYDCVYGKGIKSDIQDENLFASTNKMSRKVMVSTATTCYGAAKTFFF